MGRILAIDYGTKRTGIAVSDPSRIIAGGLDTIETAKLVLWLKEYVAREVVDIFVVGLPLQTSGAPSDTYPAVIRLTEQLKREFSNVVVRTFDERYTSVLAHRAMIDGGMRKMQRRDKAMVDKISACVLLQDFMNSREYELL